MHRAPLAPLLALLALLTVACGSPADTPAGPDAAPPDGDVAPPDAAAGGCPEGAAGTACVLDLHDRAATGCDPAEVAALVDALEARRGDWPLWDAGTALFVTDGPAQVAGEFNGWDPAADATTPLCGTALATAALPIASGRWPYKLVVAGAWRLDPGNAAFAFDDYAGNADGENSLLNTHDSGVGHLVHGGELCSTALGNCRAITTYLPRGYHAPDRAQRRYPVIFLHDGQNVFDDHDCCFGHTGWEVNVALDAGVADGSLEEAIVVAADHAGAARNDEYGWSTSVGGAQETFMAFQVGTIQPAAAARWRLDADRTFVAGSSLGGLISMRLALAYPELYAGAASLSGAFWPGQDTQTALRDVLATTGRVAAGLYVDHGGTAAAGGDGYADNVEVRDLLVGLGWRRADSPACALADDALCYHHEDGGTHDELAWRDRAWRFLRFFVGR